MGGGQGPAKAGTAPRVNDEGGGHVMRRYTGIYCSSVVGAICLGLSIIFRPDLWAAATAIGFFVTYFVVLLRWLPRLTPKQLRAHAEESDAPGYVILLVAIAIVIVTLVSVFLLLNGKMPTDWLRVTLGGIALLLSWLGVNSMLSFHYAYEYYDIDEGGKPDADGQRPHIGGLDFPGEQDPDALSFLYFSFVIAMTAQVSDVAATSNAMRRLILLHSIFGYFFNTVILAVAVNVVVSLGR